MPEDPAGEGNQPTPEEQEAYQKVVLAGTDILTNDKTYPQVVKMLESGKEEPAQALAQVTAMIITKLDEQSGGKIPEVVILPAAEEIVIQAGLLAEKEGIFQADEATLQAGMEQTVMLLAEQYGVTPEEVQAMIDAMPQDQVQRIVAEREGQQQPEKKEPGGEKGASKGIINQAMRG